MVKLKLGGFGRVDWKGENESFRRGKTVSRGLLRKKERFLIQRLTKIERNILKT